MGHHCFIPILKIEDCCTAVEQKQYVFGVVLIFAFYVVEVCKRGGECHNAAYIKVSVL